MHLLEKLETKSVPKNREMDNYSISYSKEDYAGIIINSEYNNDFVHLFYSLQSFFTISHLMIQGKLLIKYSKWNGK